MQSDFELTPKQADYIRNANHRWNVACGAVRSGKSYCQISNPTLVNNEVNLGITNANLYIIH